MNTKNGADGPELMNKENSEHEPQKNDIHDAEPCDEDIKRWRQEAGEKEHRPHTYQVKRFTCINVALIFH